MFTERKHQNKFLAQHYKKLLLISISILSILIVVFLINQYQINSSKASESKNNNNHLRTLNHKYFPTTENLNNFNLFEEENGLFKIYINNNFYIQKTLNTYAIRNNKTNNTAFLIFKQRPNIEYTPSEFICDLNICFTKNNSDTVYNLDFNTKPLFNDELLLENQDSYLAQKIKYLKKKKIPIYLSNFNPGEKLTRAQAIYWTLKLKYPKYTFDSYKGDCFKDVNITTKYSGEICFAKKQGIIKGINNHYLPSQTINLWGILKILFKTYEIEVKTPRSNTQNFIFEQIHPLHYGRNIIEYAYYEGIFNNLEQTQMWTNQSINYYEAVTIYYNFLLWKNNKLLKSYDSFNNLKINSKILININTPLSFKATKKSKIDESYKVKSHLKPIKNNTIVYYQLAPNVYEKLTTLKNVKTDQIISLVVKANPLKQEFEIIVKNPEEQVYKSKLLLDDIKPLKSLSSDYNAIKKHRVFPNQISPITKETIPQTKVYISQKDLNNILLNRSNPQKYLGYMEIIYPNGHSIEKPIRIKTRGNANKGYIKPSFTIETYGDMVEYNKFEGDEFLNNSDEIKLRGFINEETQIQEKLFYTKFQELKNHTPHFFESTLFLNNIPLGLFQITEAIKSDFFKNRDLVTDDYFYARNTGSKHPSNLTFQKDKETTLSLYKLKGDPQKLLTLISLLSKSDKRLLPFLDKQNIFDYTALVYTSQAKDSLIHNFYIYLDKNTQKWAIIPWDADASHLNVRESNYQEIKKFAKNNSGHYNQLIHYLFSNLEEKELEKLFDNYKNRYQNTTPIPSLAKKYLNKLKTYLRYDNALWNNKFLERSHTNINAIYAIQQLIKRTQHTNL